MIDHAPRGSNHQSPIVDGGDGALAVGYVQG